MRDDGDLRQGDNSGPVQKTEFWQVDLPGFSEELGVSEGRRDVIEEERLSLCSKKELKDCSKVFGLRNWKDGIAIKTKKKKKKDLEDMGETGFVGKDQELGSG